MGLGLRGWGIKTNVSKPTKTSHRNTQRKLKRRRQQTNSQVEKKLAFTHRGREDLTRSRDRHPSLKHFGADRRPSGQKLLLGEGEVPAKETGRVLPTRSANFLVEVQLGTGQPSSERRGARRPYCGLSGTLFLLGTSFPHCHLHFLFLYSCLRAGRVWRPKHTKMQSKAKEKKPTQSRAKPNGALRAPGPSQFPQNRSSGQPTPSGLNFQATIDRSAEILQPGW